MRNLRIWEPGDVAGFPLYLEACVMLRSRMRENLIYRPFWICGIGVADLLVVTTREESVVVRDVDAKE